MPSDDLLEHAKSIVDFYELLGEGIHPGSDDAAIARAYRRSALKHHPDKNRNDPDAVNKFHALQIGYDVLSDPAAKAAYDNARTAREARKRQSEMFDGRRRAMKEDLERRESGAFKRKRDEVDAEEALEREIRRLAEDGRRRRKEREEALRKDIEVEKEEAKPLQDEGDKPASAVGGTNVPEISRTVKIRWPREGLGVEIDKQKLAAMFERFGNVDSSAILKDRKMRMGDEKKKRTMASGVIVYTSIVGAHKAVEDTRKQSGAAWDLFEHVEWAEGKVPDFARSTTSSVSLPLNGTAPTTPQTTSKTRSFFPGVDSLASTPDSTFKGGQPTSGGDDGLRKVPSFASFSSAKLNSPFAVPFGNSANSPSLEELTLIRLKNAEKRRLEEQIRREDAQTTTNRGADSLEAT
jgi:DnaJ homolog subfamily C member 17